MKHNWEYKRLGDVCEMKSGSFISAEELSKNYRYPCFGGNGIRGYIDKYSHNGNYCIIGRVGALCGNVHQYDGEFYATEHAIVVTPINIQNVRWLYYQLSSLNLRSLAKGVAQPVISIGTLNTVNIHIPPIKTQERIVAELDELNGVIEAKREQLKQLDLLAQSIFYAMFGDPVTNPKGWNKHPFGKICKLSAGGDKPSDTVKERSLKCPVPVFSNGVENEGLYGYTSTAKIHEPALTISGRGTLGVPFIRLNPFVPIIRLIVAIPSENVSLVYLFHLVKSLNLKGNGVAIPQLTVPMIKDIQMPIPPLSLQEQFAAKVEAIQTQKAEIQASIKELQTFLNSRMDYWFGA